VRSPESSGRPVAANASVWTCAPGDHVAYLLDRPATVTEATLILDSALDRNPAMSYHHDDVRLTRVPDVMPRAFRVETLSGGEWAPAQRLTDNHHRQVRLQIGRKVEGVRFVLEETWGGETSRVYAFYLT